MECRRKRRKQEPILKIDRPAGIYKDVWRIICHKLSPRDLFALGQTCTTLKNITREEHFWTWRMDVMTQCCPAFRHYINHEEEMLRWPTWKYFFALHIERSSSRIDYLSPYFIVALSLSIPFGHNLLLLDWGYNSHPTMELNFDLKKTWRVWEIYRIADDILLIGKQRYDKHYSFYWRTSTNDSYVKLDLAIFDRAVSIILNAANKDFKLHLITYSVFNRFQEYDELKNKAIQPSV